MKYCQRCILPDTRPNLEIDDSGICSACHNFEYRMTINWEQRSDLFAQVAREAKKQSKGYDCVIPVSGGKDSTWQTITCLEHGLTPLCVSWRAPGRTTIGQRNLDNLISLGVDHIDYSINPDTERKFLLNAFLRYGATGIPMHLAMFNIPRIIAEKFRIPLVVWGENSGFEYGDSSEESRGFELTEKWLKKYGVTHGTTAWDWIDSDVTRKDLAAYLGSDQSKASEKNIRAVFLGYYFPWDPMNTYMIAQKNGFSAPPNSRRTGWYEFADIDDEFMSIHHYMKWFKFGFTRGFDNLSIEIRHGRLTRNRAIDIARTLGDEYPESDIKAFCKLTGISSQQFLEVIEAFRNPAIWKLTGGNYRIPGFLIEDWSWCESLQRSQQSD
ncbi:MAG: N-acetyl sugar amidotransferase [Pseudomonadota bacterium]|nr:N-acetyl sugar amidotransferase [Pseudomonadota bacterium]